MDIGLHSMPTAFESTIGMEVDMNGEENMEMSESDVDMETALAMDIFPEESVHGDEDGDGEENITALDLNVLTSPEQELVRDYYLFFVEHTTVKSYAQFVKHRVGRMSPDWLPKSFDTLRTRAHKIIGISPNPIFFLRHRFFNKKRFSGCKNKITGVAQSLPPPSPPPPRPLLALSFDWYIKIKN